MELLYARAPLDFLIFIWTSSTLIYGALSFYLLRRKMPRMVLRIAVSLVLGALATYIWFAAILIYSGDGKLFCCN